MRTVEENPFLVYLGHFTASWHNREPQVLPKASSAPDESTHPWARRGHRARTVPPQETQHELYPGAHAQGGGIAQIFCA